MQSIHLFIHPLLMAQERILRYLCARDLVAVACTCRTLRDACSSPCLWQRLCRRSWSWSCPRESSDCQRYVPAAVHKLYDIDPKLAYRSALTDSKTRNAISLQELTSFEWSVRFKRDAGEGWVQHDPWCVRNRSYWLGHRA